MTLQDRDKRALSIAAVAVVLTIGWWLITREDSAVQVVGAAGVSVEQMEKRLQKLRSIAAAVPAREKILSQVKQELDGREKGLIQADTAQQAQAQLVQIVRRLARAQSPPMELRGMEIGQAKVFGNDYGEVAISVNFDCKVEQLVNFLADLTAQKEIIATQEMNIGGANPKEKNLPVRMMISGLVRKQLVPEKKGLAAF